jgi:hypothetical protein
LRVFDIGCPPERLRYAHAMPVDFAQDSITARFSTHDHAIDALNLIELERQRLLTSAPIQDADPVTEDAGIPQGSGPVV